MEEDLMMDMKRDLVSMVVGRGREEAVEPCSCYSSSGGGGSSSSSSSSGSVVVGGG